MLDPKDASASLMLDPKDASASLMQRKKISAPLMVLLENKSLDGLAWAR
ncbi:hypothetical protein [Mesorhizobium sp. B2-8-9]|nr:hypothetical protein [Mesorhizobium sp. B2-8-9]